MSDSARTRRSERKEAARAAMLQAAIELLSAKGYSGMKFADVSRVSGYSYGLAPLYFESKAGLMLAIQEQIDVTFTDYMAAHCNAESPGRELVDQWVKATLAFAKEHPSHWRASVVILVESVIGLPAVAAQHSRFVSRNVASLRDAFERGIWDGSIPPSVDPYAAAVTVASMIKGIHFDWFGDPSIDLDERCELVLGVVRQLVGPS